MGFTFNIEDIDKISKILECSHEEFPDAWSWNLKNQDTKQAVIFTIYNRVKTGREKESNLISVQTLHGYFELHSCTGYILFEPDEVIFINSEPERVTCLIIGKQATCSLYSNIDREILNSDFSSLDSPVLMSAMQLSLVEEIL
jgi:hypothetical protein